jgi:hypothetical protein
MPLEFAVAFAPFAVAFDPLLEVTGVQFGSEVVHGGVNNTTVIMYITSKE